MAYNFDKDGKDKDSKMDKGKDKEAPAMDEGSELVEAMSEMPVPDMSAAPESADSEIGESMESPAASEAVDQVGASGQPGELLAEKLGMTNEEGAALFELSQTINKYQGLSEEELAERLLKNPYERNELEIKLARESGKPPPMTDDGVGESEDAEDPMAALGG